MLTRLNCLQHSLNRSLAALGMTATALGMTFTLLVGSTAGAQTANDRDLVRKAVLDYVEGFYEGDTVKLVRGIRSDVHKYGYWIPRDSTRYTGEAMPWPEFLAYANRVKANKRFAPATAPKDITVFDVLDQTASAKLVAYWGVDYLLLAKTNGNWMVTHVIWQTPPKNSK
jgi:hypothetical protein